MRYSGDNTKKDNNWHSKTGPSLGATHKGHRRCPAACRKEQRSQPFALCCFRLDPVSLQPPNAGDDKGGVPPYYGVHSIEEPYLFEQSTLLLVKTHGLGPAVPHSLRQNSFTEGVWLSLTILGWCVNLLEDPDDNTDDTTMNTDASRCVWALYYGRRPRPHQSGLYPIACRVELHMGCII